MMPFAVKLYLCTVVGMLVLGVAALGIWVCMLLGIKGTLVAIALLIVACVIGKALIWEHLR